MTDPYRIFPRATAVQRAELATSIEAVGLQCSVVMDEFGNVIDGHERRDVCEGLGIDWMAGADVRIGLSHDAKKALAIDLNLKRRPVHIPRAKLRELIDIYLIAHPELSGSLVADLFGVSQPTVSRRKEQLIQMNKLNPVASTVGKDGKRRKVGQRSSRLIVKSRQEFNSLMPDLQEMEADLNGLIRRPQRYAASAARNRKLRDVANVPELPGNIQIEHCDWRDLVIEPGSVDLVLTDVVWNWDQRQNWSELAETAADWLNPNGLFASYIGTGAMYAFASAVSQSLRPLATIAVVMPSGSGRKFFRNGHIQRWYAVPLFGLNARRRIHFQDVVICPESDKQYGEWQQSLPVAQELVAMLSEPNAIIVDPHLGTGTNAVAVALAGQGRSFIGCDIDAEMVRIARHRVHTETDSERALRSG